MYKSLGYKKLRIQIKPCFFQINFDQHLIPQNKYNKYLTSSPGKSLKSHIVSNFRLVNFHTSKNVIIS